jgi:hypothetical protein
MHSGFGRVLRDQNFFPFKFVIYCRVRMGFNGAPVTLRYLAFLPPTLQLQPLPLLLAMPFVTSHAHARGQVQIRQVRFFRSPFLFSMYWSRMWTNAILIRFDNVTTTSRGILYSKSTLNLYGHRLSHCKLSQRLIVHGLKRGSAYRPKCFNGFRVLGLWPVSID